MGWWSGLFLLYKTPTKNAQKKCMICHAFVYYSWKFAHSELRIGHVYNNYKYFFGEHYKIALRLKFIIYFMNALTSVSS